MRLPYAAKTLIDQVAEEKPRAKVEFHGEPDGYGVVRTIKFSKSAGEWLAPLLEAINDDRIESINTTEAGYLHVTFVSTPAADDRAEFPLQAAAEVVKGSSPPAE